MTEKRVPKHIGIIMDGNGRWAKERGKPRSFGHKKGADILDSVVDACAKHGVNIVSLYAFSTENWSRPQDEIDTLFDILRKFLKKYRKKLLSDKRRLTISGDILKLPDDLRTECEKCIETTKDFTNGTFNIALNYGSRQEIVYAVNRLIGKGKTEITAEDIQSELYTSTLPDIDLVIRTSGEQRLSNFFLWQCAYAELYFTDTYWPDFNEEELVKALDWYASRNRRYGGIENK